MRHIHAILHMALATILALPVGSIAAAPAAQDAIKKIEEDKSKTNAWVETETVSRISRQDNSSLTYVALNLARVKDEKTLKQVFDTANNDRVDEVMDRATTVAAIKKGLSLVGGGAFGPGGWRRTCVHGTDAAICRTRSKNRFVWMPFFLPPNSTTSTTIKRLAGTTTTNWPP